MVQQVPDSPPRLENYSHGDDTNTRAQDSLGSRDRHIVSIDQLTVNKIRLACQLHENERPGSLDNCGHSVIPTGGLGRDMDLVTKIHPTRCT